VRHNESAKLDKIQNRNTNCAINGTVHISLGSTAFLSQVEETEHLFWKARKALKAYLYENTTTIYCVLQQYVYAKSTVDMPKNNI
jgi:hypothetical protein